MCIESVNPFRVQCETCQAWLKVRDESLIGQIHGCPKCGGMVHLVPMERPEDSASASVSMNAAPAGAAAGDYGSVGELGLNDPPAHEAPRESEPAEEFAEGDLAASPAESMGRKVALGVGGGGAALAVVGVLVAYVLGGDKAPPAAPAPQVASAEADARSDDKPAPQPEKPLEVTAQKPASDEAPAPDPKPQQAPEPPPEPEPQPPREDSREPAPGSGSDESNPPPAPAPPGPAEPSAAQQEIDPLDYDPENLDLVLLKGGPEESGSQDTTETAPAPSDNDEAGRAAPQPDERVAMIDRSLAERAQVERVWVERGLTGPSPITPAKLARRLGSPVPELQVPRAPLVQAVRLWSELAGVPVTIDPAALARAGVGPHTRVSLAGRDAALGEVLLKALEPARLGYAERGNQLVVVRRGANASREASYSVSDLGGAEEATQLATDFVPSLGEEGVTLSASGDKLQLSGPAYAHFDLAIFCERLRLARGKPQRTKYPDALLRTTPALASLETVLGKTTTFSFVTPTALTDVVDHWRKASGLEILVDWASLADQGLGPYSTLRCSATDRTWREALDGVLTEVGLGWRAVGDKTIQVTTEALASAGPQTVEFYPVTAGSDAEEIAESLREEARNWKSPVAIHYDVSSGALLVRGAGTAQKRAYAQLQEAQQLR